MVGHRFVECLVRRGATVEWDITVIGEETRGAYDRVHLTDVAKVRRRKHWHWESPDSSTLRGSNSARASR